MRKSTRDAITFEDLDARMGKRKTLRVCNNTTAERPGRFGHRQILIYLHGHHIATLWPSGAVEVTDCDGWRSVTTKARLNCCLRPVGAYVSQTKGRWVVTWSDPEASRSYSAPFEPFYNFRKTLPPFHASQRRCQRDK